MKAVLDSSAVLALLWKEPGSDMVAALLHGALVSAVNLTEIYSKLLDRGFDNAVVCSIVAELPISIVVYDEQQARSAGALREATRKLGLSIGDRACLALAIREKAAAITADAAWRKLDLGIEIQFLR